MTNTPPGWYPDATNPGQQRYWDGTRWTEHVAALTAPPHTGTSTMPPGKPKRSKTKLLLGGIGAFVVLIAIIAAATGGGSTSTEASSSTDESASTTLDSGPADEAVDTDAAKPAKKKQPEFTGSQENAIRAAKQYLDLGAGFSRRGLIQQLSSPAGNDFPRADAVFAVNHIDVDYNEQAVLAAKNYTDLMGFSRSGLVQQLTSSAGSKFTKAQAEYAADKIGLN